MNSFFDCERFCDLKVLLVMKYDKNRWPDFLTLKTGFSDFSVSNNIFRASKMSIWRLKSIDGLKIISRWFLRIQKFWASSKKIFRQSAPFPKNQSTVLFYREIFFFTRIPKNSYDFIFCRNFPYRRFPYKRRGAVVFKVLLRVQGKPL